MGGRDDLAHDRKVEFDTSIIVHVTVVKQNG